VPERRDFGNGRSRDAPTETGGVSEGFWYRGRFADRSSSLAIAPRRRSAGKYQFGSICCSEVAQYAAAFNKGELDEEKTAQIRQHIAKCPHCGPEFQKTADQPQASLNRQHGRISTASLAHSGLLIATR
jgi:hypothetical protein